MLALGALGFHTLAAGAEELLDGIAAQVGSEIVLASEVYQVAAPAEARLRDEGGNAADLARLRVEVLDRLIERALVRQVVRRAELDATEVEVDEAVAAIAMENDLTVEQLHESVESQGLPFEVYRETIRGEIEQSKVLNGMVAAKVRVEESEIRDFYQEEFSDQPTGGIEVHLRHLMVPFDPENPDTRSSACAEVRGALARVRAGESFELVAYQVSQVNPKRGGDIGWLHLESLASWMAGPVRALELGATSDLLETTFGCNLLYLVDRRDFEPVSYEDAREQIRKHLFNKDMAREYSEFMEELRSRTYIERKGVFTDATRLETGLPTQDASEQF
jgi:peptidyl-prolyl cis-trans isomerase SurA